MNVKMWVLVGFAFGMAGCATEPVVEAPTDDDADAFGRSESALTGSGVSAWSMKSVPVDENLKIQVVSSDGRECSVVTYTVRGAFLGKDAEPSLPHERSVLTTCATIGVTGALVGVTIYHPSLGAAPRPYVFYGASSGDPAKPSSYDRYVAAGYRPSFGTVRALEILGAKLPTLAPSDDPANRRRCTLEMATASGASNVRATRRAWHYVTSAEARCTASGVL